MQYPFSILINNFRQKLFLFSKEPYTEQYFSSLAWICTCLANFPHCPHHNKTTEYAAKNHAEYVNSVLIKTPPPPPKEPYTELKNKYFFYY